MPLRFERSQYLEQSGYYEELVATLGPNNIAVWETNRGCPYRCSFCDWGSNTMSKVRRFEMDRLAEECEWFGRTGVGFIMLADANFGILPRDLDIVDMVVAANARHGKPSYFSYNVAKNNPDRTVAIAGKLLRSGLTYTHVLSVQHTNDDVLAATDRSNISVEKQVDAVRRLLADEIPIYVQLILGIPGDTYRTWKACFTDLMEWGIHAHYWVFPYNLLPNAPASEPEYLERWQIETVDRYVVSNHGARAREPFDPVTDTRSKLVVKTRSFSPADWIVMSTFTAWVKALHNAALTQSIAIYLRFTHDLPYARFYDEVIEGFCQTSPITRAWNDAVVDHYRWFLDDEHALDFMDVAQLPRFESQIEPSRWLYVQICFAIDEFYEALSGFLTNRHPDAQNLASLVDYQRNLVVLPSYDREVGHSFDTDLDWVTYLRAASRLTTFTKLDEPEPTPGATVLALDRSWSDEGVTMPHEWGAGGDEQRTMRWIHTTVTGRNSARKNNFQELQLRRPVAGRFASPA